MSRRSNLALIAIILLVVTAFLTNNIPYDAKVRASSEYINASSVCGRIIDPLGEPIYKALVEVYNSTSTFLNLTNEEGIYCFPNLSPGNYTVRVEKYGMQSLSINVKLVRNRVAVLNDVNNDIEKALAPEGYKVIDYSTSVSDLIQDLPKYEVVIINKFIALPSSSTLVDFLRRANSTGVSLIFLDTNSSIATFSGVNTLANYGIHVLAYWKSAVESAGFPAPDNLYEGIADASQVCVTVTDTNETIFTNVTYDCTNLPNSFYLANLSVSHYALYSSFKFNESSVKHIAKLAVNNTTVGYYAAYWTSNNGVKWYFISAGPSYYMSYSPSTGADSVYSESAVRTLVNAVREIMPLPKPLGDITMDPEPGNYLVSINASLSYDGSRLVAYIRLNNVNDPSAEWLTTPSSSAHLWLPGGDHTLVASNPAYGKITVTLSVAQNLYLTINYSGKRIDVIGDWRGTLVSFLEERIGKVVDHHIDISSFLDSAEPNNYSVVIVNAWYNPFSGTEPTNFLDKIASFMDMSYNNDFSVVYLDTWFLYVKDNKVIDDVTGVQALYKYKNEIPYQYGYPVPSSRDQDYGEGYVYIVINTTSQIFEGIGSVGDKIYVNTDQDRQDFAWIGGIIQGYKTLNVSKLAIVGAENLPFIESRWGIIEATLNNYGNSKWFFVTYAADLWQGEDYAGNGYTEEAKRLLLNILLCLITENSETQSSTTTTTQTTTSTTTQTTTTATTTTTTTSPTTTNTQTKTTSPTTCTNITETVTTTVSATTTATETVTETYTTTTTTTHTETSTVTHYVTLTSTTTVTKLETIYETSTITETVTETSISTVTYSTATTETLTTTRTTTVINYSVSTVTTTVTKEIQTTSPEMIGVYVIAGLSVGLLIGYLLRTKK